MQKRAVVNRLPRTQPRVKRRNAARRPVAKFEASAAAGKIPAYEYVPVPLIVNAPLAVKVAVGSVPTRLKSVWLAGKVTVPLLVGGGG